MKRSKCFLVLLSSIVNTSLLLAGSDKEIGTPGHYKAVIVQPKTARLNPATQLDIVVERYTSDSERMEYVQILKEKGPEALLRKLESANVGRISTPGQVGVAVALARIRETEGGKRIRLVTTRPVSFLQARRGEISSEYPYTIMDLYLDESDKGNGSLLSAVKVLFDDDGELKIQGWGGDPLDLINVELVK